MDKNKTKREAMESNLKDIFNNGPRLAYGRNTWVEEKDTKNNRVLLGGLGALGVGTMWFKMEEYHKNYINYDEAPEVYEEPE